MPDPLMVEVIRGFEARLLAQDAAQMADMARRWLAIERDLDARIQALADRIALMQANGEIIAAWRITELAQYLLLAEQVESEVMAYAAWASEAITAQQLAWAELGRDAAVDALRALYLDMGLPMGSFETLPVSAIEAMIGYAGDGTPLRELLTASWPSAVDGLTARLLEAVATGQNPRDTAAAMREGLSTGLDRMLTIARTEQLRAYRTGSLQQYRNSGVVTGYKRICAKQDRTCLGCLAADGEVYDLESEFDAHPNCRCTLVPIVAGMPDTEWETGAEWFEGLDEDTQRAMMGPGIYELWSSGQVDFADLDTTRQDATWGGAVVSTSLSELEALIG